MRVSEEKKVFGAGIVLVLLQSPTNTHTSDYHESNWGPTLLYVRDGSGRLPELEVFSAAPCLPTYRIVPDTVHNRIFSILFAIF